MGESIEEKSQEWCALDACEAPQDVWMDETPVHPPPPSVL